MLKTRHPPHDQPRGHHMGDSANSAPDLVTQLLKNSEFVTDLARYNEQLLTEQFIRKKYGGLSEATWTRLGESDELVHAIQLETIRRTRNGSSKRERAQALIIEGPAVLGDIMRNSSASPRHRVDAVKALDSLADNGPEAAPAGDNFTIRIILSADEKLTFSKHDGKVIDASTTDTDTTTDDDANTNDDAAPDWLPAIAAKKNSDPSGGVPW
jgi:hypothetical protein